MLFLNNTLLFYLLFSQTLRVSIFYRVVPYIQHSTVQPLLTNFLFHMKNIWSLFATWASQVVMKSIVHTKYTYLQNKRMRRCGVAPPPIIFERLKLPQQIIYRRKENLSESPNHKKYWENILVSRFYEQFSRNRRNLGHFRKFEKISNSQNMNILYIILKHVTWRFQIYNLFREIFKFREDKSNNVFREIRKCFRKTAKFDFFSRNKLYIWNLQITRFKMIYNMFVF